jgi:DNA-binding FrmR family transcriptional regulator
VTIVKKKAMKKTIKKTTKQNINAHQCHGSHQHPDHSKEAIKLKKAKGQIEAILGMIEKRLYCPDILIQVRAAKSALSSVEQSILKTHLDSCVAEAIKNKDEALASKKIEEIIKLIGRHQ